MKASTAARAFGAAPDLCVAPTAAGAHSYVDDAKNGFQGGSTDPYFVFEAERRLRAVQFDLLKLKIEPQAKDAGMERLAGGSL